MNARTAARDRSCGTAMPLHSSSSWGWPFPEALASSLLLPSPPWFWANCFPQDHVYQARYNLSYFTPKYSRDLYIALDFILYCDPDSLERTMTEAESQARAQHREQFSSLARPPSSETSVGGCDGHYEKCALFTDAYSTARANTSARAPQPSFETSAGGLDGNYQCMPWAGDHLSPQ
jgi:hypothetical protein